MIEQIYNTIAESWTKWAEDTGAVNMVIGISGGKDSSVVAALATKIFGPNRVFGVLMPQYVQSDIGYAKDIVEFLNIPSYQIDIGDSVSAIYKQMKNKIGTVSQDTIINLPARIRMTTLFAVAQTVGGRVINTCNASENMVGYSTLFGDCAGTYAPLHELTVQEIIELGRYLDVPEKFLVKPPQDGLCGQTDEEKLGFTYAALDDFIRYDKGTSEFKAKIRQIYNKNKFKLELIQLPHPTFDFLKNYVIEED